MIEPIDWDKIKGMELPQGIRLILCKINEIAAELNLRESGDKKLSPEESSDKSWEKSHTIEV